MLSHFETSFMSFRLIASLSNHDALGFSHGRNHLKHITSLPHQQKCHKWLPSATDELERECGFITRLLPFTGTFASHYSCCGFLADTSFRCSQ
jgi:hypothetical protein